MLPVFAVGAVVGMTLRVIDQFLKPDLVQRNSPTADDRKLAQGTELTVLTLNAALTEWEIMNAVNGLPLSFSRCRQTADYFLNLEPDPPDVVCLQEVFSIWSANHLAYLFHRAGYSVVFQRKPPKAVGMSSGLFIASRFPILDVEFHAFSEKGSDDALAKKGVLVAWLGIPAPPPTAGGGPYQQQAPVTTGTMTTTGNATLLATTMPMGRNILVATTHMQAGGTHQDCERIQRSQLHEAQRWLAESVAARTGRPGEDGEGEETAAALLVGDFNCCLPNAPLSEFVTTVGTGTGTAAALPKKEEKEEEQGGERPFVALTVAGPEDIDLGFHGSDYDPFQPWYRGFLGTVKRTVAADLAQPVANAALEPLCWPGGDNGWFECLTEQALGWYSLSHPYRQELVAQLPSPSLYPLILRTVDRIRAPLSSLRHCIDHIMVVRSAKPRCVRGRVHTGVCVGPGGVTTDHAYVHLCLDLL
eukprot:TRINITY_DN20584_c0_g1_i3.p1 TRINITY_DN20584_c0_g1~~TRINITY_DN20584_c0_g1_i3.p1  ORF type:complete len:473 (+),score=83.14 TRINITY_DN20584_c0_g1_i3:3-1421(+)